MKREESLETPKSEGIIEDVDIAVVGRLVRSGNRFYISIPSSSVAFYDLKAKDQVHLKIDKVKKQPRPVYQGTE